MPHFHAIVAMSENRVIGDHGKIPWRLPEDFRWFKHKTMGATLIMGRKTRQAIGRELPGRTNLVLSRAADPGLADSRCFTTTEALLASLPDHGTIWVVGGAEIYRIFLPLCACVYLTRVKRTAEGDVFFPAFEDDFVLDEVIHENADFRVERWRKSGAEPMEPEAWPFPATGSST
jgi:dihydrofolate reductase